MIKVAVIGTGIAGMACAARLHPAVDLHVFESAAEPGGHTHTVDVEEDGKPLPVDTGFMVYNEVTYPRLTALFAELNVPTVPTVMSFGLRHDGDAIEFCGSGLNQLFAQRANLLRPRFWSMLRGIMRFNKCAYTMLGSGALDGLTMGEFVHRHGFGEPFLRYYLIPMTSAIWSTPPDGMLDFPAHTLIRFLHNHGLLGVRTQHQWRTVVGGSRTYRDRLIAPFADRIRCSCPVRAVTTTPDQRVRITLPDHTTADFDAVVLACHADTSLKLLTEPTDLQRDLLAAFPYTANTITLHTDSSVMPRSRRAWASWNYRIVPGTEPQFGDASTHYWMNSLQQVSNKRDYFVSVNGAGLIRDDHILESFVFDHPQFAKSSAEAQAALPQLNANGPLFFCGSYFRYGFHEDGLMAGEAAAQALLQQLRPSA
jgi:predicted NAD/FAD-binding protein